MLERDYIMRILQQFYNALHKLVNNIDEEKIEYIHVQLKGLYPEYLKRDDSFFYENDISTILHFLGEGKSNDSIAKITLLSELIYNDAILNSSPTLKKNLLSKALELLLFINDNGKTFSAERDSRIVQIREILKGYTEF